jgi:hypothetical protein
VELAEEFVEQLAVGGGVAVAVARAPRSKPLDQLVQLPKFQLILEISNFFQF